MLCHKKIICYTIKWPRNVYTSLIEDGLVHYHGSCHGYEEIKSEISHSCAISSTAGSERPGGLMVVLVFASTGMGVADTVLVSVFMQGRGWLSVVVALDNSDLTSSSNLPSKP